MGKAALADVGWHWSREPGRYVPCSCPCCRKCWFDLERGRCVYGGPFDGFVDPDGKVDPAPA